MHQFYANRIISYMVNDRIFRMGPNGALGSLMSWMHYIPKKKFSNDLKAVRLLFQSKEQGRIIGIFPEGRRNWDGATEKIIASISTLAKSLKIPIVAAIMKGGFSSQPRWSGEVRKGRVEIEYKMIMDEKAVKESSAGEILETIQKELNYKEHEYLKGKKIFFKAKEPADGLERLFFMCPSCHCIGKFVSSGDKVRCECGYTATYNNYAEFSSEHFDSLVQWNGWQKAELKKIKYSGTKEAIFTDYDVTLSTVPSNSHEKLKVADRGTARLFIDKIVFEGERKYEFPIDGIWGCNVQQHRSFEFNHDGTTYFLTFPGKGNAYKWVLFTEL
jgi:1-acyl-sn-glycerol-3-phosphate acyltransferase